MAKAHTQMWDKAREVQDARSCAKCGREAGRPCKNLRTAPYKPEEDLVLPHKARYEQE